MVLVHSKWQVDGYAPSGGYAANEGIESSEAPQQEGFDEVSEVPLDGDFVVPELFFANKNGALFDSNFLMVKYIDETGMDWFFWGQFGKMFFCLYVELLSCFGLVSVECSSLLQILAYCPGGDFVFFDNWAGNNSSRMWRTRRSVWKCHRSWSFWVKLGVLSKVRHTYSIHNRYEQQ